MRKIEELGKGGAAECSGDKQHAQERNIPRTWPDLPDTAHAVWRQYCRAVLRDVALLSEILPS